MARHLVLGGARSGKSAYAERQALADRARERWIYVATAGSGDREMRQRIEKHRAERDPRWQTIEQTTRIAAVLDRYNDARSCVLVDCLTLWLSHCLAAQCWPGEREAFLEAAGRYRGQLVMVSNEVGSGVVPMGELSRQFVDESGRLHQALAAICERVTLVTAGLPLSLKGDIPRTD